MLIIGCDYHPSFQQVAFVDTETGECGERRLVQPEEAKQFYSELKQQNLAVRVGMQSSGHARWFERLLCHFEFELWIGDAAEIRTKRVRCTPGIRHFVHSHRNGGAARMWQTSGSLPVAVRRVKGAAKIKDSFR